MELELVDVGNDHNVMLVDHLSVMEAEGSRSSCSASTCMDADQHVHLAVSVAGALALATRGTA
eukprot:4508949-Pyramimonas_sp.AAC.1